jgi:hypothetical protein
MASTFTKDASDFFEVPEFYTMRSACLYTSQGDVVCYANGVVRSSEPFTIEEKPNMPPSRSVSSSGGNQVPPIQSGSDSINQIIGDAMTNKYCKISIIKDDKSGSIQYNAQKECTNSNI